MFIFIFADENELSVKVLGLIENILVESDSILIFKDTY